jgi:hypothetical protein
MESSIKRKRGPKGKMEQHPAFEREAEKLLIKGASNQIIADRLNALVKKLRSEGKLDHLDESFSFSLNNAKDIALRLTRQINQRAARKHAEREAIKAYSQAVDSDNVGIDSLLLSGQLLEDMITRVVLEMDDQDTNEIDIARLDQATLTYKRLTESKRIVAGLFDSARKRMAEQLLEAAKREATLVSGGEANPVAFVQRLIEQANESNRKQA